MDALPVELLELILLCLVRKCHAHKSQVFPARFVCKAFDKVLRPYVLKTIRFDMWQFLKDKPTPDSNLLPRIGGACEALHLDMMLLRDDSKQILIARVSVSSKYSKTARYPFCTTYVPQFLPLVNEL